MPQPEIHVPDNPTEVAIPEHNEDVNPVYIQQDTPEKITDEAQELFKNLYGNENVTPRDYAKYYPKNAQGAVKSGISLEHFNQINMAAKSEKLENQGWKSVL